MEVGNREKYKMDNPNLADLIINELATIRANQEIQNAYITKIWAHLLGADATEIAMHFVGFQKELLEKNLQDYTELLNKGK